MERHSVLFTYKRVFFKFKWLPLYDAILPRKGPVTKAMSKRLQEDWARAAEEGPRVLRNLRVDF